MRFFIALEVPLESREQLVKIQAQLKQIIPNIKLTSNEKFHITYAFIGEQPEQLKESLIKIIQQSAQGIESFSLTPAYLDGFPNLHHAKIIWIGLKGDIDKLFLLRERIKDGLNNLQLDTDERRFIPHITIAKTRELVLTPEMENKLQEMMEKNFMPIAVSSIKLFESVANQGFHQHNTLAEIKLTS